MKEGMKVIVEQTRSGAARTVPVKDTLLALGLGRIGKRKEHVLNPCVWGMLRKVRHLVKVYELK